MMVLVDTPVWSLALRRSAADLRSREEKLTEVLRELIREGRAQIVGAVRQELLSGIRVESSYKRLRDHLHAFDEPLMEIADYEEAAHIHNRCRAKGVAGSSIDFLICAAAMRRGWQILTTDRDFERYAKIVPVRLFRLVSAK